MPDTYNILALGDAVSMQACEYLKEKLWGIRKYHNISFTVINGENSADGNGMLPQSADALIEAGADAITGGNHTFRRREVYTYLDDSLCCVRPANMPASSPGYGSRIIEADGKSVLVINMLGSVYMDICDNPFDCADKILEANKGKYDYAIVDFHAEATSEKAALAHYLDGRVSAFFGTHTHVATADEQIMKGGTGFITDLGMVGVSDSILGVKSEIIIEKFTTRMPVRFEQAHGDVSASGTIFTLDKASGKCIKVQRISF